MDFGSTVGGQEFLASVKGSLKRIAEALEKKSDESHECSCSGLKHAAKGVVACRIALDQALASLSETPTADEEAELERLQTNLATMIDLLSAELEKE